MAASDLDELSRKLADSGRLIEAGWISLRAVLPPDTPPMQVQQLRWAFMAGAQHLFSSIMAVMDPGEEPTEDDQRRMELIDRELEVFAAEVHAAMLAETKQ